MTVEKPESVSRVPEQEHISETEKTARPVDEKVAAAATSIGAGKDAAIVPQCEMGAVESEGTPLKVQDVVSRVAKEPVKAHRFKEAILGCLEREGVHAGAEITDEVKRRVVEAVVRRLIGDVFRGEVQPSKKFFDTIPLEEQLYIFDKCLECQKGESGENTVIAIAKLCAQQDGRATTCNIQYFGITDQKGLIEIAKLCAQQDGRATTWNIQYFGITDQKGLIEIAKLCAKQNGEVMASNIQNFGIKDQKGLIEIAKLCARQNGWATAMYFENFGITDQGVLIEIAKMCAKQDGEVTARNIQNLGITDQKGLIEIAKLCAQQAGEGTAWYIQNFGIKDQDILIEIAKLCARQNGRATTEYIKNFGIDPKNQTALIEIAKLCAKQNGGETAKYIQNFGIKDQDVLIEIAKLCAKQDGWATAKYIQNFGIEPTNQAALIAIAKLCGKQNGKFTAMYFKNFGIKDQDVLIEIAKLCAQEDGGTAGYIKNFGIEPTKQADLIDIAKLCAQEDGGGTAAYIQNFGIADEKVLIEIGVYCVLNETKHCKDKLNDDRYFFVNFPDAVNQKLRDFYSETQQDGFIERCQQELGDSWKFIAPYGKSDIKENLLINKEMLVSLLFACKTLNKMDALKSPRVAELMAALLAFRTPSLKPFMLEAILDIIVHDKIAQFDEFILKNQITIPGKAQNKPLALMTILAVFSMQSLDPSLKTTIIKNYLKYLGTRSSFLANAPKTAAFIEFVRMLNDTIPVEKQKKVYEQFLSYTSSDEFSRKLFVFQTARSLGVDVIDKDFAEVQGLVHQQISFPEGFEESYEKLRRRESLLVYLARINVLPESDKTKVKATLATYLQEVKEGTFTERRYALSPQLIHMSEERWGSLIEKWKQQSSVKIEDVFLSQGKMPAQQAVHPKDFLQQKRADGHFPTDKMPLLSAVLDGSTEVEGEIKKVLQSKDPSQTEQKFDALCARLALSGRLDRQLIQEALDCAPRDWELRNDLQGLVELSKSPLDAFTGYTVVNTDDHWDLFLCGTEVAGSCQRVDGEPQLNKNLLGYVVDGKVRMIAVKDPTGRIAARSIIKLLWDDVGKKPVLFMERVYSNNSQLNEYVTQMARKESARLGIELVTAETAQGRHFLSYPNRSGFEYEDSKDVVQQVLDVPVR